VSAAHLTKAYLHRVDLTWHEFLALAVSSGAAAGLANQGFRFFHDWLADRRTAAAQARDLRHQDTMQERELLHQRDLQREEREHQGELRREAGFFEARKDLLAKAVGVREFISWWWGRLYGSDVDYYPVSLNIPAIAVPADAISALADIAGQHPFKAVRTYARDLADSIDGVVNMPDPSGDSDPGVEQLSDWLQRSDELIESLHDPSHAPAAPAPARAPGP
jgi:hypothetical protein